MRVKIGDKFYLAKVGETYIDGNQKWQEEIMPLEKWVDMVSKKSIGSLYAFEDILSDLTGVKVVLKRDYPNIREPILNFSGSVKRLPDNLIFEEIKNGG